MIKRLVALSLVLLLSIESFAAVVGDNDGAAFITKAEFDSLKSSFQEQINRYNQSIDNKIDGAIAQYLAGITINNEPTLYADMIRESIGQNLKFLNYIEGTGSQNIGARYVFDKNRWYSTNWNKKSGLNTFTFILSNTKKNGSAGFLYIQVNGQSISNKSVSTSAVVVLTIQGTCNTVNYNVIGTTGSIADGGIGMVAKSIDGISVNLTASNGSILQVKGVQGASNGYVTDWGTLYSAGGGGGANVQNSRILLNDKYDNAELGSGNWIYRISPSGGRILERYCSHFALSVQATLTDYTYVDHSSVTVDALDVDTIKCVKSKTNTYLPFTEYGNLTDGDTFNGYSTTEGFGRQQINSLLQVYGDDIKYEVAQFAQNTDTEIYCTTSSPGITASNDLVTFANLADGAVEVEGKSQSIVGVTNQFNGLEIIPDKYKLNEFYSLYLTSIAGETVYYGGGAAIMETAKGTEADYRGAIKVHLTDKIGNPVAGSVTAKLSYKQFKDGNYETANNKLLEGTITCDATGEGTLDFSNLYIPGSQKVWINLIGSDADRIVELVDFNAKNQ